LSATDLNNGDAVAAETGRSAAAVAVLVRRLGLEGSRFGLSHTGSLS
jgi:hypothetical protein